jgi:hypothetical protein
MALSLWYMPNEMPFFYQPSTRLSVSQRSTFCMGIKIFNNLPSEIANLIHDIIQFKKGLKILF